MPRPEDDYVFFWQVNSEHGWASQWYYSPFKARIHIQLDSEAVADSEREVDFPTAEHWMMACKALIFSDTDVFNQVLEADASDMRTVKALGREVKNFDDDVWKRLREHIVLEGSLHKFRQNEELRGLLLATEDKFLVEASPRDRIWGVGFGAKRALEEKRRWGLNLLGKALMETREILRQEEKSTSSTSNY